MMAQYLEIKKANEGSLLFYRMGDFYEMFFDDAIIAAQALDIALTKRGTHMGETIPMCGVPVHAAENYLNTLIKKGFRVSVAEQLEDPAEAKKRGAKSVVKRDVTRLITPGTLTEEALLEARQHNYLAAWACLNEGAALAWADISTGELRVVNCPSAQLALELSRLEPREILISDAQEQNLRSLITQTGAAITPMARASFDSSSAQKRLCKLYQVETLDAYGDFPRAQISAMGALIDYLEITQRGNLPLLQPPVQEIVGSTMQIDQATRKNLELNTSLSGEKESSLISAIDKTVTAAGARLLKKRISAPSCDLTVIKSRLETVRFLYNNPTLRDILHGHLRQVPDMDRALSRLALERAGPRDLAAIRAGLTQAMVIEEILQNTPGLLKEAAQNLTGHQELVNFLSKAIIAEPPLLVRDGGFIASGFDPALDEARSLRDEGRGVIAKMQVSYIEQTGIQSLKIKHNNVLGYFIETPATHAEKMLALPLSETFIHRQTTAGQIRFTTLELNSLETRILNAGNQALELEKHHYEDLRKKVLEYTGTIGLAARALAEVDLFCSFADIAAAEEWTEPQLDHSRRFQITAGRHPVVEYMLKRQGDRARFVANDCHLSDEKTPAIWLLTGPNMAGKSTFLRQNALIALLAQAGSFVPASEAKIGIVSQLFSRVGASDDLAHGRSTFMVEMVETANILNRADDRAFVILDEIGRGTSTYDGLSIAWATLEYLHNITRCRTLFATHYHEMTALEQTLPGVKNTTVVVKEWDGEIIFMHEVKEGAANRSYGVQVAQLAGIPPLVIERAKEVLEQLEQAEGGHKKTALLINDLPLFKADSKTASQQPAPKTPQKSNPVEELLAATYPDELSPIDALRLIYKLKELTLGAKQK